MSLGYAERLSHREDLGGRLGDPELFEAPHVVLDKSKELAELVSSCRPGLHTHAGHSINNSSGTSLCSAHTHQIWCTPVLQDICALIVAVKCIGVCLVTRVILLQLQIRDAAKLVVFTGAGISTAAGIPDFRGPQGVWTLQRKGLPLPKLHTSFVYAKPSLTHQALLGLLQSGKLQYICSQNVDSLHLRSGELCGLYGHATAVAGSAGT
jgi:hypothetical protein